MHKQKRPSLDDRGEVGGYGGGVRDVRGLCLRGDGRRDHRMCVKTLVANSAS